MDVVWTAGLLLFLHYITIGHTANIGFVRSNDDTSDSGRSWDSLPRALRKVLPPRRSGRQEFNEAIPAKQHILGENKRLGRLVASGLFTEGDIYVGQEGKQNKNDVTYEVGLWPDAVVPYEIHRAFDAPAVEVIEGVMDEFRTRTCIQFVPRTTQTDYLHIYPGNGCWSVVGRGGGRQPLSLGGKCTFHRTVVMHEFMHALGFGHEQSRPDRDEFVEVQTGNIKSGQETNFRAYSSDAIQDLGTEYDYYSIMHYHHTAFSANGRASTITPRDDGVSPDELGSSLEFTDTDITKLITLYNCRCREDHELGIGDTIEISTPSSPRSGWDCIWRFTNVDFGRLQLSITIPASDNHVDYLQYGSGTVPDLSLFKLVGETFPSQYDILINSESAWVLFSFEGIQGSDNAMDFLVTVEGIEREEEDDEEDDNTDECGQVQFNLDAGESVEITSPYHPQFYGNNHDCTWTITNTDGGNVEISFSAFNTESGYDYVQVGSGSRHEDAEKISGTDIPSDVFYSAGDTAWVYFHSDGSTPRAGFVFTATASGGDDDGGEGEEENNEECGGVHQLGTDTSVEITSPNYPGEYGNSLDCTWIVTNKEGGNVRLLFSQLHTEATYDYVQFGNGRTPDTSSYKHSGTTDPDVFQSEGDTVWVFFHSDSSYTANGFSLTATAYEDDDGTDGDDANSECGNNRIDLSSGSSLDITSPNYPENYGTNLDCTWTVVNTDGGNVRLTFFYVSTEANYDYIQFGSGYESDPNAAKFSGSVVPHDYVSEGDTAWIFFHSDGSQTAPGFQLTATAEAGDGGDGDEGGEGGDEDGETDECGESNHELSSGSSVEITSPNYPEHYDNEQRCTWTITNINGGNVRLSFSALVTEPRYDYIQFGSSSTHAQYDDSEENRFSGNVIPEDFTSDGDSVWVVFHSDSSNTQSGFSLTAYAVGGEDGDSEEEGEGEETEECGQSHHDLSSGDSVEISSPFYPEFYNNQQDCIWTITNVNGGNIQLSFSALDTEPRYDYVQFGSGSTPVESDDNKYSGTDEPMDFTSEGDSVWIIFHSDGSVQKPGFLLMAVAVGGADGGDSGEKDVCGPSELYIDSENSVDISSPFYPDNYDVRQGCIWIIINTDETRIQLTFTDMDTEENYDYVQVGSGTTPYDDAPKLSGSEIPETYVSIENLAWVTFVSDATKTATGFLLTASAVTDGGYENDCGVGNHELATGSSVDISSPNHPNSYGNNQNCTWTITNIDGGKVQLNFVDFGTESRYDYVRFGSGSSPDSTGHKHSGTQIPDEFTSTDDTVWITFFSDGSKTGPGFLLSAIAVEGDDGANEVCGETHRELENGNTVEISSPNYPENYGDNQECTWILTNRDEGNLQLKFSHLHTENAHDYVQFGSGNTPDAESVKYSGTDLPGDFLSEGSVAWVTFYSDGSKTESGFTLTAIAVSGDTETDGSGEMYCGGFYYLETGEVLSIESPNYPYSYDNNLDCTWTFIHQGGDTIIYSFTDLEVEPEYDYVQFGDGSTPDKSGKKYSGPSMPSFRSTGSEAWLTFHSDGNTALKGFRLAVSTAAPAGPNPGARWRSDLRCGPKFPLNDGSPTECDPQSENYCCSADGVCGSTASHCFCKECIDYSAP